VIPRAGAVEPLEDLLEGAAADAALTPRGQLQSSFAVALDELLLLQGGEEGLEIDVLRDVPLLLKVTHPVHGLVDVSGARQDELVEQAQEVEPGEDRPDQLGIEVQILMAHDIT
jgi:hypothetical protein